MANKRYWLICESPKPLREQVDGACRKNKYLTMALLIRVGVKRLLADIAAKKVRVNDLE